MKPLSGQNTVICFTSACITFLFVSNADAHITPVDTATYTETSEGLVMLPTPLPIDEEIRLNDPVGPIQNNFPEGELPVTEPARRIDDPYLRPAVDICTLERARATTALSDDESDPGEVVARFIRNCPRILTALVFEEDYGDAAPFTSWNYMRSARLKTLFTALVNGEMELGLACPDVLENMAYPNGTYTKCVYYTAEQAFDVFAAHVAHVLYLELTGALPWSILSYTEAELDELLASDRYFAPIKPSASETTDQYPDHIEAGQDFQRPFNVHTAEEAIICDPRDGYRFIRGMVDAEHPDMLGPDPEETLVNLTAWLRDNVGHGDHDALADRTETAQYSMLSDRLKIHPRIDTIMALSGCHSAAALIYDLAKSVNIPLLMVRSQDRPDIDGHYGNRTHSGLVFRWESEAPRLLLHSDDIYANNLGPAFPLGNTGYPLLEEDANRRFFDEVWTSPDTLTQWHFELFDTFPMVFPAEGFGEHSRGQYEDFYEYSEFAGYWPDSVEGEPLNARDRYNLEQQYHLCGKQLLSTYCHFEETPWNFIYTLDSILGPTGAHPLHRDGSDFYERAAHCVQANGGCDSITDRIEEWSNAKGSHSWPR